jgi:hypothetical protein
VKNKYSKFRGATEKRSIFESYVYVLLEFREFGRIIVVDQLSKVPKSEFLYNFSRAHFSKMRSKKFRLSRIGADV